MGLAAFAFALCLRVLFVQATQDSGWVHCALFKGDAHVWVEYARALRAGDAFELGLPLRPPGTALLLASLGETRQVSLFRFVWTLLGAVTVGFLAAFSARAWGTVAGLFTGLWAGTSIALLMLASSLDAETPYLTLVAGSMLLVGRVPTHRSFASWAALQGLACLFRVEHVLFAAAAGALWLLGAREARPPFRRLVSLLAVAVAAFAAVLAPWHARAWREVARFNTEEPARSVDEERALRRLENDVRGMDWDSAAIAARAALPAFARRTSADFLAATVAWRGGRRVSGPDFTLLGDAFGSIPRPLAAHPFVALYGPLNFALANQDRAIGGFSRAPLEVSPLLQPSPDAYPPELVSSLPPPDLTFAYPPHLALVNDGYRVGGRWVADHPGRFAGLVVLKLRLFFSGTTLGFTGYGWPLGVSGTRRLVDLTVPQEGGAVWVWRLVLLVLGVVALRVAPRPLPFGLMLWGLFALSKVVVAAAFFGYARQGALLVAPLSLLFGMAAAAMVRPAPARKQVAGVVVLALIALGVEGARAWRPPVIVVDGEVVGTTEPAGEDQHRDSRVEVR